MTDQNGILLGASHQKKDDAIKSEYIWLKYANRHGLITGATGTGKTVTLQVMAESFSQAGVPVFCADIKGDLSGIAKKGELNEKLQERAKRVGLDSIIMQKNPVIFWDLFGNQGHPIRATVSEMGPLLLSRLMELTPAQEGVLNITFRVADEEGLLLLDLKDLQSMLAHVGEKAKELSTRYGNVSKASIGAIQRQLLVLESQGAKHFFGEPALKLSDIMRTSHDGRGMVSVLAADKLMFNPRLYSTFLLWLMSELFEQLPEVGDPEKPRLVFFFDEAHLLFNNAPKALIERIEQVVRLIRSKGIGIYFISQNPLDVPESVLAQLGNRIQHALRAYTPRETAAVKAAASTFRVNPDFDTMEAIGQLATGEALVSTLEKKGIPSIVQKTLIRPPSSQIGPIDDQERQHLIATSPISGQYDEAIDRESAYEMLARHAQEKESTNIQDENDSFWGTVFGNEKKGRGRQSVAEAAVKSVTRSAANSIGRSIAKAGEKFLRGVLGNLLGGKRR
ncbi:helicase HerA-like C-terminal domain-containing protein [Bartonella tamiae]|uniref:Helicase HerA-like C-terminal domain-containing protein n=1 Tax=Bartonella tamiae Th239 TaxID=1094558 RepID=J0ZPN8_9HYPH|nr:helicase HerA-like C-terminal domain-containing protein [Bartonella tamiae]EJF90558.1 hypothetical protein ME5_00959 [Bartonella tamiae Th239]EJF94064.1 hypothetical protein MEG_00922 [Bartonella tamiae Th307]